MDINLPLNRAAFDNAAALYDTEFDSLPATRRLRRIVWEVYTRYFNQGETLLELNCGTGTDVVFLARNGIRVHATDVSPKMVFAAQKKIQSQRLEDAASAHVLSYGDLQQLGRRTFDGAYSNMGGLNCTNELDVVAEALAALIVPGGYFIATVMPDFCLWETIALGLRFRWGDAFRRRRTTGNVARVHGGDVRTYYHAPRTFASAFAPYFDRINTMGLNIFTPPPNSTRAYERMPNLMKALERLDERIAPFSLFASISDHYVMVLRRKPLASD